MELPNVHRAGAVIQMSRSYSIWVPSQIRRLTGYCHNESCKDGITVQRVHYTVCMQVLRKLNKSYNERNEEKQNWCVTPTLWIIWVLSSLVYKRIWCLLPEQLSNYNQSYQFIHNQIQFAHYFFNVQNEGEKV